jgi:hypothetical protein
MQAMNPLEHRIFRVLPVHRQNKSGQNGNMVAALERYVYGKIEPVRSKLFSFAITIVYTELLTHL